MRAVDLIQLVEDKFPNDILMVSELADKERTEYVAAIKLIAFMKLLTKDK